MIRDVDSKVLIEQLSKQLVGVVEAPEWAAFVKTGHGKQRPPVRQDWWHVRAASILLSVQKLGPVGVSKLSVKYGTRKNKGYKPEKHSNASRNIIRKILQQLETRGFVKKAEKDVHKGRIITSRGIKLISDASKQARTMPAAKPKAAAPQHEKPVVAVPKPEKKKPEKVS